MEVIDFKNQKNISNISFIVRLLSEFNDLSLSLKIILVQLN